MTCKKLFLLFALLPALFCPLAASAQSASLTRTEDFVVLTSDSIRPLLGAKTTELRLYSCARGECSEAPMQVDKVDALGRYVFPQDRNQQRDGELLDPNDEICFMASDAGDRLPVGFRPEGAVRGVEIELVDPLDNGRAWAYIFDVPGSRPDPSLPDYVDYMVEDGYIKIKSERFEMGYKIGNIQYDFMRMKKPGGGMSADVLDRQSLGLRGKLRGESNINLSVPESLVRTQDIAVIDGPVRVVGDQIMNVHIGSLSFQYGEEFFLTYYRCGQNNRVDFSFPAAANTLFETILFYYGLDFTEDITGSSYIDANRNRPVTITSGTREGVPDDAEHYWYGIYGPSGTVGQALDFEPEVLEYFLCEGLWRQDPEARDRKGDHPGRLEIGFACHEAEDIPEKQDYNWMNFILFPEKPGRGSITELTNIFEFPLEIRISPVSW